MAEDKATFTFAVDEDASAPAHTAAAALAELRDELTADTKALSEMKKAMRDLKSGGMENSSQFKQLAQAANLKSQAIAKNSARYIELGGSFKKTGNSAYAYEQRMKRLLQQQNGDFKRSNQQMIAQLRQLTEEMGGSKIVRLLTSRIALMAGVTAAMGAGLAMLVKYGVAAAEGRRAEALRLEGLTKLRNYFGVAAGNADEMHKSLDRVAASTALSREKVADYQAQLYKMGVRGKNLDMLLGGMATKAVVHGEEQAKMFASWGAGLALTGGDVKRFADDVQARLGPTARKHLLQWDVQILKFHENLQGLFADLDIEPLQEMRQVFFDLFSKATPSGQALSTLVTSIVQLFANGLTSAAPFWKDFFRSMLLFSLKLSNAFLGIHLAIKRAFANVPAFHSMRAAAFFGYTAVMLLAAGFGILAVEVLLATWPVLLVIAALWGLYSIWNNFAALFDEDIDWGVVWDDMLGAMMDFLNEMPIVKIVRAFLDLGEKIGIALASIEWAQLGRDLVSGIVRGIEAGWNAVTGALSKLGKAAWSAFKTIIGAASPSKLFAEAGKTIPQGIAVGINADASGVQEALADIASPSAINVPSMPRSGAGNAGGGASPSMPRGAATADEPSPAASAAAAGKSGGVTVTIESVTVNASGGDAKTMATDFVRELEAALESAARSMGAAIYG